MQSSPIRKILSLFFFLHKIRCTVLVNKPCGSCSGEDGREIQFPVSCLHGLPGGMDLQPPLQVYSPYHFAKYHDKRSYNFFSDFHCSINREAVMGVGGCAALFLRVDEPKQTETLYSSSSIGLPPPLFLCMFIVHPKMSSRFHLDFSFSVCVTSARFSHSHFLCLLLSTLIKMTFVMQALPGSVGRESADPGDHVLVRHLRCCSLLR
jgi:hypothetical protein